jgi:hypothetical protein
MGIQHELISFTRMGQISEIRLVLCVTRFYILDLVNLKVVGRLVQFFDCDKCI